MERKDLPRMAEPGTRSKEREIRMQEPPTAPAARHEQGAMA